MIPGQALALEQPVAAVVAAVVVAVAGAGCGAMNSGWATWATALPLGAAVVVVVVVVPAGICTAEGAASVTVACVELR